MPRVKPAFVPVCVSGPDGPGQRLADLTEASRTFGLLGPVCGVYGPSLSYLKDWSHQLGDLDDINMSTVQEHDPHLCFQSSTIFVFELESASGWCGDDDGRLQKALPV